VTSLSPVKTSQTNKTHDKPLAHVSTIYKPMHVLNLPVTISLTL